MTVTGHVISFSKTRGIRMWDIDNDTVYACNWDIISPRN